ncbi:MAG: hypothetical protein WAK86_00410 [Pseudonocardiaceae bacterium]
MSEQQGGVARPPYPREPNVHSGGTQDPGSGIEKPPYDDRQTSGKGQDELEQERQGPGHDAGPRVVSDAERGGVGDADMAPEGPHGVGAVTTTSGEDLAPASEDAHTKDRLDSGLSDLDSKATPGSPATSSGDQGG